MDEQQFSRRIPCLLLRRLRIFPIKKEGDRDVVPVSLPCLPAGRVSMPPVGPLIAPRSCSCFQQGNLFFMPDNVLPNLLQFPAPRPYHSFPTGASKSFGIPVGVLEHVQPVFQFLDFLLKHVRSVLVALNGYFVRFDGLRYGLSCEGSAGNGAIRRKSG